MSATRRSSPPPAHRASPAPAAVAAYRDGIVRWYREHARDLPWRRDPTPYRVWVSEIMLQQTRVEAVRAHYVRFLERFPDLESLAKAAGEEVLEAWSGLGYYRRARNLHAGARWVRENHGGEFPAEEKDVLAIPGVGRYTAGAIRSIALGARAPIVDGNVTRVLCRVFAIEGDASRAAVSKRLWEIAARTVAEGDPAEVNQAQMEIGALVCTPRSPVCDECPLAHVCLAKERGLVDRLPELPRPRPSVDVRRTVLLVRDGTRVLLRRRRDDELLPGLWDLPGAFTGAGGDVSTDAADAAALVPFALEAGAPLGTVGHGITYRRIRLDVVETAPAVRSPALSPGPDGAELAWCEIADADGRALSSPARKILKRWGVAALPGGRS